MNYNNQLSRHCIWMRLTAVLVALQTTLYAESPLHFTFSGVVTEISPELSSRIQETFVFSGSLQFTDRRVDLIESSGDAYAVYQNFIAAAEVTFDENYVLKEEASLGKGDSEAKVYDREPNSGEPDLVKFLIPVDPPQPILDGYNIAWFELLFYNDTGSMINGTKLPRHTLAFTSAGFRVSFYNKETQLFTYASGILNTFDPEDVLIDKQDDRLALETIILELNAIITDQRDVIQALNLELIDARRNIAALQAGLEAEVVKGSFPQEQGSASAELKAEINALNVAIEKIESKERNAQKVIDNLTEERAKLKEVKAKISQDLQEISVSLIAVKDEMDSSQTIIAALNREIADKDHQIQTIQSKLDRETQAEVTTQIYRPAKGLPLASELPLAIAAPPPPSEKVATSPKQDEGKATKDDEEGPRVLSLSRPYGPKRR